MTRFDQPSGSIGLRSSAQKVLAKLFEICPTADVGCDLAKCYHQLQRRSACVDVLKACIDEEDPNPNVVNMICEVYMEGRDWHLAYDVLTKMQDVLKTTQGSLPPDLVAKLACNALNIGKPAQEEVAYIRTF